jgi:hypothetical protein
MTDFSFSGEEAPLPCLAIVCVSPELSFDTEYRITNISEQNPRRDVKTNPSHEPVDANLPMARAIRFPVRKSAAVRSPAPGYCLMYGMNADHMLT